MPRWLRWWLALTLFCVWSLVLLVGVPAVMSAAVKSGEPEFTDEERTQLLDLMPQGRFAGPGDFRNCENGHWIHYTPTHDSYWLPSERRCWR